MDDIGLYKGKVSILIQGQPTKHCYALMSWAYTNAHCTINLIILPA